MGRVLRTLPAPALMLAIPGLLVVIGLWSFGADGGITALACIAVIGIALFTAVPPALSLATLIDAIERLEPDTDMAEGTPVSWPGRLMPIASRIWLAVLRVRRAWRERLLAVSADRDAAEAVIAGAPEPLILIDRSRRIVRANAASSEFVGVVSEPRDLAASLRNPALLAAVDAVLRVGGRRIVEFEVSIPVARILEARVARIEGPAVGGGAAVLTLHDVTALKRAEQMRADFVANAGHELKTPLTSLVGFIETLLGPARDDAAARERFLGIMREQAGRMARLVDDLLSLSRIELNEHVPPTAQVTLEPVIEQVAAGLELRAAARQMRIVCSLPRDLPVVIGEADELAQVFQNLIDNAIKYGRLQTEITVSPRIAEGLLGIAVADRGDGIADEHLPRLTERFYRVDSARSRELGGTGLGLAIVKHILNRHRGRLDIESTPGVGSTFTVWLRLAPPSEIVAAAAGDSRNRRHQTATKLP
ncbi:MAG TPA: ATP-binding protein [Stellaceae bacterium]|jgi:two-component system phosphate regulon sensor histidine kinase PhoR|nr:ATP-binding protein [Stellaceae bacterium]